MGLKFKSFKFVIFVYFFFSLYVLKVTYATPLLDIELQKENTHWTIEQITYSNWAVKSKVSEGDIVLAINDTQISNDSHLQYDPYIRGAQGITIQKQNGDIKQIAIRHQDLPEQWYMQFVLPLVYFIITLFTTLYLHYYKKDTPSINLLIKFILVVSLAYISSGASARMDTLSVCVNSVCLLLSIVLLLQFIKNYFDYWHIKSFLLQNVKIFYVIPIVALILRAIRFLYPPFTPNDSVIILSLFLFLLLYVFVVFIEGYMRYRLVKLKFLFIGLFIPFIPFILFFLVPEVVMKKPIFTADICALFLLLIPFNIIFFHLTERLFDLTYYITRFRYYFLMGFFLTCWIVTGLYFLLDLSNKQIVWTTFFLFSSIIIFLYIKEKLDYLGRNVLFSSKGNHMHQLYQIIKKIGTAYKVEEILRVLIDEISQHLEIKKIAVITYFYDTSQLHSTDSTIPITNISKILSLSVGDIMKEQQFSIGTIHQDSNCKRWIIINHQKNIRLKAEELIWLELILTYTSVFIESTKVIEELIAELQQLKREKISEPTWMKKLIWFKTEDEKFKLAQELHDTVLQEYIHIARQMDLLLAEQKTSNYYEQFLQLHKQMLQTVYQLRAYCETLKPPLLQQIGLHIALERLAEKIKDKAKFTLNTTFDRLYLEDEQMTLSIYRIVQELLNNGMKHSKATYVELSVLEINQGFKIFYQDNGVGCDVSLLEQSDSLGIYGIKERVSAFDGQIIIESELNQGFILQIIIYESENINDFLINS